MPLGLDMGDRYLIVANYREGTKIAAPGAKVYVLRMPGSGDEVEIVVRSRGGRYIQKWERLSRLETFRIKTVVEAGTPPKAWKWASSAREALADLLDRCRR